MKNKEKEYLDKVEQLENNYKELEFAHHDKLRKLEKKFFKEQTNIEMVHKMKKEELIKNAQEIATREINEKRETMIKENQNMIKTLSEISKEYNKLKEENQKFTIENNDTKILLSLKEEEINEYQEIISQEKNVIMKLKQKVSCLKSFLSEEGFFHILNQLANTLRKKKCPTSITIRF